MNLLIKLLAVFISIAGIIDAQSAADRILKSSPYWQTNFEISSIDLDELMSGGPPKDGIPALLNPQFVSVEDAEDWLDPIEPVIFLKYNNVVKAYPLQILIWHEIVNDQIDDMPVIVTFCPLCYSAIVFDRRVDGLTLGFGVSGLLRNSDMIMYDLFTESFWQQFTGEALVGDMTGTKLKMVPSQIISFKQLIASYPGAMVLSQETGFTRRYGMNPYSGYDDFDQTPFLYNGKIDDRLPPNEKVIAIREGGLLKAYPYSITFDKHVINDTINGRQVVVFHAEGNASALDDTYIEDSRDIGATGVFDREVNGEILTFGYRDGLFVDNLTNSEWDITGKAVAGKLKDTQLKPILHGDYFAFAWFAFKPETLIYSGKE